MTDQATDHAKQIETAAKKKLADEKAAREKIAQEAPEAGKPTPTQEENDLAALGVHVPEHEPDGSPEEAPHAAPHDKTKHKQSEANKPASTGQYQTRAARPESST